MTARGSCARTRHCRVAGPATSQPRRRPQTASGTQPRDAHTWGGWADQRDSQGRAAVRMRYHRKELGTAAAVHPKRYGPLLAQVSAGGKRVKRTLAVALLSMDRMLRHTDVTVSAGLQPSYKTFKQTKHPQETKRSRHTAGEGNKTKRHKHYLSVGHSPSTQGHHCNEHNPPIKEKAPHRMCTE